VGKEQEFGVPRSRLTEELKYSLAGPKSSELCVPPIRVSDRSQSKDGSPWQTSERHQECRREDIKIGIACRMEDGIVPAHSPTTVEPSQKLVKRFIALRGKGGGGIQLSLYVIFFA